MIPVNSSNISSIGYNEEERILFVEFNRGPIYQYFDVPKHVYQALLAVPSKGDYFIDHIKHTYRYSR